MPKIVVDSTCDLPRAFAEEYAITTLPLHVMIGETEYLDRVTITTDEVYEYMRQGVVPKTSQVGFTDTYETLEALAKQGDDVLCLAFSSKMSGTCALISGVMEELKALYPQRRLQVLDSKGGSFATGLVAMEAAKAARAGMPFEALVQRCLFLIDHVEHVFVINNLDWLVRGGRVSRTMGYVANLLDIKPILDVKDGEMEVIAKVRGRIQSMKRVADILAQRVSKCVRQTIGITHANNFEAAEKMRELLHERLPECEFFIEKIGAVLGSHLGIGGIGVFAFTKM